MKITKAQLAALGACQAEINLFARLFGDAAEVTEALCIEHAAMFNWNWAAKKLLTAESWAEFERVRKPARAEYQRAREAACAEYQRVEAPAWAEFQRVKAATFARLYCIGQGGLLKMSVHYPRLSNPLSPSDADLLLYAQYIAAVAQGCDLYAEPGQVNSPWETIGALRGASRVLAQWLIARMERAERLADELRERLQLEAQDEQVERWSPYDRDTGIRKSGEI